ncbi:MAG: universal stress protein [Sedimenticolaceae bacterium]
MLQSPKILLVPLDGSKGAEAAASYAAALAAKLGIPIRLLFAFPKDALEVFGLPPETMGGEQLESYSPAHVASICDQRANHVFGSARRLIGDSSVQIEQAVLTGDPATAILDHAEKVNAPLIIMGSRGLSRFSEMLMGSVSHRVLHHAKCPVTIVHSDAS